MVTYFNAQNFNQNQLQNALIHPVAADPSTPLASQIWFHTTAGGDGQGRLKVKLSTRTLTIDDQYVGSVTAGGTPNGITIGGTALAPTISMALAASGSAGAMSGTHYDLLAGATNAATANALVKRDASGNASFNQLSVTSAPVNSTDVVNKGYADTTYGAGWDPKSSVVLATTGALPACTYANGTNGVGATLTCSSNAALTTTLIDGTSAHTLAVGDRVLVKNQAVGFQNGIYVVTVLGSGATPWVLTRATDFNTATSGFGMISNGAFTSVEQGSLAGTIWMVTGITDAGLTLGTTSLTFTSFQAAQVYSAGAGLNLSTNTFSINLTGVSTLETSSGALRVKSSATAGQVLISQGNGNEAAYGAVNLASSAAVTGILPKANGGFGQDVSTGIAANLFAASPSGASGAMSFRAITAADIPALDFSKISTGTVPVAQGGTGSTTAAGARTNLGAPGGYPGTITGDGTTKDFTITPGWTSTNFKGILTDPADNDHQVVIDTYYTSTTVKFSFSTAPANGKTYNYRITG